MRILLLACVLVTTRGAIAGPLADAVDAAWRRQPEARALVAHGEAASARLDAAASPFPRPGSLTLSQLGDQFHEGAGRQEWEAELAWPLWLPGQWDASRDAAAAVAAVQTARLAASRAKLTAEVRRSHLEWRRAQAALRAAEARAAFARALGDDLRRRERAGEASRFEANLGESERFEAERALREAERGLARLDADWRLLTGSAPPPALDAPSVRLAAELERAEREAAAARAEEALSRASTREAPEIALRFKRERNVYGEAFDNSAGIALRWSFAASARQRGEVASAGAERERLEAERERLREALASETRRLADDIAAAERSDREAVQRHALASDNLQLAEKAWRLGQFDLAALLRARQGETDAADIQRRAAFDSEALRIRRDELEGASP